MRQGELPEGIVEIMKWKQGEFPSIDMERFGRKLREICREKKVSAGDLQKFLHLGSIQAVYMWFEGKRIPNLDNLFAISKYLGIRIEDLLEDEIRDSGDEIAKGENVGNEIVSKAMADNGIAGDKVMDNGIAYRANGADQKDFLQEMNGISDIGKRLLFYWKHL